MHRERQFGQERGDLVYLIAWVDDVPVGHAYVAWPDERDWSEFPQRYGCPEVRDLWVEEPYRRIGLGRALMENLEAVTVAQGFRILGLTTGVDDGYTPARKLYQSMRYRVVSGPFIQSFAPRLDDGTRPVWWDVLRYWLKDLE